MKLIVISYPTEVYDEHIVINNLFENGLEIFHLRKPSWSATEMASLIYKIDVKFHNRIVIHSNYELYKGLKGIHFTFKTKNTINEYSDLKIQKSISCHSFEEIDEHKNSMDYMFISPVFDSISKKGYKANIDFNILKKHTNKLKIIALGGVSSENIIDLKALNLYGVAVLGDLWENNNIIEKFNLLQECVKN